MNKLRIVFISLIASALMVLPSTAKEVRVGIAAGMTAIAAEGKETLKSSGRIQKSEAANIAVIPSIFAEFASDNGFGLGLEVVSGSADINSATRSRTLDNGTSNDSGTNKASAEVDGLDTIYLIKKFNSGLLVKFGKTTADVTTVETLSSGTTYGNKSVDGTTIGIGWETSNDNGLFVRTTVESTSFDSLKLTGSQAGADAASFNVVDADIDMTMAKISVGKVF